MRNRPAVSVSPVIVSPMTGPELARLERRVDMHDENHRVVADTVLDVQKTVHGHTRRLGVIERTQKAHTATLDAHTATLDEHTRQFASVQETLAAHSERFVGVQESLAEILRRLDRP